MWPARLRTLGVNVRTVRERGTVLAASECVSKGGRRTEGRELGAVSADRRRAGLPATDKGRDQAGASPGLLSESDRSGNRDGNLTERRRRLWQPLVMNWDWFPARYVLP